MHWHSCSKYVTGTQDSQSPVALLCPHVPLPAEGLWGQAVPEQDGLVLVWKASSHSSVGVVMCVCVESIAALITLSVLMKPSNFHLHNEPAKEWIRSHSVGQQKDDRWVGGWERRAWTEQAVVAVALCSRSLRLVMWLQPVPPNRSHCAGGENRRGAQSHRQLCTKGMRLERLCSGIEVCVRKMA